MFANGSFSADRSSNALLCRGDQGTASASYLQRFMITSTGKSGSGQVVINVLGDAYTSSPLSGSGSESLDGYTVTVLIDPNAPVRFPHLVMV
jgi:hypothetical protein